MNTQQPASQEQKDLQQIEELINAAVKSGVIANIQTAAIVHDAWMRIKMKVEANIGEK